MSQTYQTFLITSFALIAFAANSILCRSALVTPLIDPANFTVIRILSGAITLIIIFSIHNFFSRSNSNTQTKPHSPATTSNLLQSIITKNKLKDWLAPCMLFTYATLFSFAYVELNTASGALILFASVQFFMLSTNIFQGNRFNRYEWLGIVISFSGFIYLILPSASQPSINGFLMMLIAGIAWAIYTLLGKSSREPIKNTTENFIRCIPFSLALFFIFFDFSNITFQGFFLAIASGSIASGLGYTVWYTALRELNITQASISQLSVPIIASIGGVLFVNEPITLELIISGTLVLSGIGLVTFGKLKNNRNFETKF